MNVKVNNLETNLVFSPDSTEKASYYDLILLCTSKTVSEGYTFKEMKKELDFIDKVEKAKVNSDLELNPKELEKVKKAVESFKWPVLHKDILSFCEYVDEL